MNPKSSRFIRCSLLATAALSFLVFGSRAHAVIDQAATQQIWKLKYGVSDAQLFSGGVAANGLNTTWLDADDDGDGAKNGDELALGTNPFSVSKPVKVKSIAKTGTVGSPTVTISFDTENDKAYRVDINSDITNPSGWVPQASPQVVGDGGTKALVVPFAAGTYYRVRVLDTDTDGDGVSDWAEKAVSLNPNLAETNLGASGTMTALAYVTQQVAMPNVVTITAAEPFASEDGPTAGKLMVTRTQNLFPLTVNLNVSNTSTAVPGTDYQVTMDNVTTPTLPSSVVFAAQGALAEEIFVNPMPQSLPKGGRSVTATASPAGTEFPFTPTTATVIINPSTVASGTGLLARYYDTASSTQADAANFGQLGTYIFTRGTPTTNGSIVVTPANPANFAGLQVGNQVKLTFTSGNAAIDNSTFDHQIYNVIALGATTFTVSITSATAFSITTTNGNCAFSIQTFPQIATLTRVDPTVNFDWAYGTPNDVSLTPTTVLDNYSTVYEGYLSPTTAGGYRFQLDADDKARVLVDLDNNGTFDLPGEQVVEHGWDTIDGISTPEVVGTFKIGATKALVVPAGAAQRYKIRIEHVETTDSARCRVQWSRDGGTFANIPSTNLFTHATTSSYLSSGGTVTVTTPTAHNLVAGTDSATLWFSAGALIGQATNYSGTYPVVDTPAANTFTVAIAGAPTQASSAAVQWGNAASTTAGMIQSVYANTTFSGGAGSVSVQGAGPNQNNNGIFGAGSPDAALIAKDTFSARWTGQIQPQFSEDYTLILSADDGCALTINGQPQVLRMSPSASTGGSTYSHNATTGDTVINYAGLIAASGNYVVGETVRLDFSSGNLSHAPAIAPTYRYDDATGDVVVDYTNLTNVTPGGFVVGETIELDPTSGGLSTLGLLPYVITAATTSPKTFTVNVGTLAFNPKVSILSIAIGTTCEITTVQNHGLTTGQEVKIAGVTGGTFSPDINGTYTVTVTGPTKFTVASDCTAVPANGAGTLLAAGNITVSDNRNAVVTAVTPTTFTVNVGAGKYADASAGNVSIDIVNKALKNWSSTTNERYVHVPMVGGVRYDIQLDYYENTALSKCQLSWYSASQPRQIIPAERLYPSSGTLAPPAPTTPTSAIALVGGGFSHPVAGSNGATVTFSGKPSWLNYADGVLSGTPPVGTTGDYQIVITITNAAGTSTSLLNLHVDAAGGSISREFWNGAAGTTIAQIPVASPISGTTTLSTLEAPTDFGDNYGARIRGYITAPITGNYYFWIAGSNAAELWISNDDEPVNALKRAWVNTGSTTPQTWNIGVTESGQKSPWMALEQGQKYYIEILHKAGVGSGDNLAVGWSKPGQDTTVPSEVVPGFVLSPYVAPSLAATPGTLYVAEMLSQNGASTTGVGTSTLRLSADENTAYMKRSYSGLSGMITSEHIHSDPYLIYGSQIIFDIDAPTESGDGIISDPNDPNYSGTNPQTATYKWTIKGVQPLTKADIVEIIKEGKAYVNLHTGLYPLGEIRGNYTLANGSRSFTPPPNPPNPADDHTTANGASRFLTQATFGPNPADIAALKAMASYDAWIEDQFTKTPSYQLAEVLRTEGASAQGGNFDETLTFNAWWKNAVSGPDQLRQRVAFALSQIHVVSAQGPLADNAPALSYFYDHLVEHAFDNFRSILEDTTLTPAMGRYLDMLRNDKPDLGIGRSPNENYAREIKQLFSIGLFRMWPDGSLVLSSKDELVPTYTQREIVGFAHAFTGWDYGYDGADRTTLGATTNSMRPMRVVPARHFTGPKRILNNEVLPGLPTLGGQPLDPYGTHNSANINDPAYKALPNQEFAATHDQLFNHPNVGPFICRQLIQRMVTSNPSRDYLYRVVQKFNNNGSGVRGDMKAVIKAVLLDYEARSIDEVTKPAYGKQKEPVLRVASAARAFRPAGFSGTYAQTEAGGRTITVTTSTAHQLASGNNVFLDFTSGSPAPWVGTYSATVTGNNTFTVTAPGWTTGTYSQSSGSNVMTISISSHWLPVGGKAFFDFTSGTANGLLGFDKTVQTAVTSNSTDTAAGSSFTITAPDTTGRSGNVMVPRFSPGSFTSNGSGLAAPLDRRVTMDTNNDHHLNVGDQVQVVFFTGANPIPADRVVTVEYVVDLNTWTFLAPATENSVSTGLGTSQGNNSVYQFPLVSQPLVRNGNVSSRPSTFAMGTTDGDFDQSPLNSPTVFNFFLPGYKFPGALASQGLTTPEFQDTAETNVIREANFFERGVYALGNTNGLSSFKSGSNALVMDLSPWMANAVTTAGSIGNILGNGVAGTGQQTGQAWTSNANLPTLIDRLNTLLIGGRLHSGVKAEILKFVGRPITAIALGNPCTVTLAGHGFKTGDTVTISGVSGGTFSPTINGTFTITVPTGSTNTFTVPVNYSTTGGSVTNAFAAIGDVAYTNATPTDTNKRDRLRAVLHFLLTSPDFIIQR